MSFSVVLPYIVSVVSALIAGLLSYFGARKQAKEDIARIEKQNELDIQKEREKFAMEKEKIELEHKNQIELLQKQAENNTNSELMKTIFTEAMKNPDIQRQISQGVRNGNNRNRRNNRN